MPLVIVSIGLALFILMIAYGKLNPFLAFIIISIGIGIASGMGSTAIAEAIQVGIGNTLGGLVIILGFGAMPDMVIKKIGYGAGQRELKDRPNLLRVILGNDSRVAIDFSVNRLPNKAQEIIIITSTPYAIGSYKKTVGSSSGHYFPVRPRLRG